LHLARQRPGLHAFASAWSARPAERTSHLAQFACKSSWRGRAAIVEFARAFRNHERGALPPEFTLVEWYRAGRPTRC
jgi:elongation factor P--beta-lysine ligase